MESDKMIARDKDKGALIYHYRGIRAKLASNEGAYNP